MKLILYSKPGCCLCEGLLEKLQQIKGIQFELEIRDITSNQFWLDKYQYEIPVLCLWNGDREIEFPRLPPRSPVSKLEALLEKYIHS